MEYFYRQILDDAVFHVGADVVFLDWEGEYLEVEAAMESWCSAFERLAHDMRGDLKLLAIRKMGKWLRVGTPIPDDLIKNFREELDACIRLYSSAPAYQIVRSMKTEQIAIELGVYG